MAASGHDCFRWDHWGGDVGDGLSRGSPTVLGGVDRGPKFAATALMLGLSAALACFGVVSAGGSTAPVSVAETAIGLMVATAAKLAFEAGVTSIARASHDLLLRKSAVLMAGALKRQVTRRVILGIIGGIVLPAIAIAGALRQIKGCLFPPFSHFQRFWPRN